MSTPSDQGRFTSWDALLEAELQDEEGSVPAAPDLESPGGEAGVREALMELPLELIAAVYALSAARGDLAGMSRRLGRSRQEGARRLEAIREHFSRRGFSG